MNKNYLLCFTLTIFILGSISALDFDNVLTYSNNDLKVQIDNAFGLGDEIGAIELKSHKSVDEIKEVIAGENIPVMWYEFNFNDIYEKGLGEVYFTDMRTGKEIEKDYYFAYLGYEDVEVNDYEKVLIDESLNGTKEYKSIIVGTHTEQKEKWIRLEENNIPKGKIIIALITDVNLNDYIDGVWTIAGKEISKHATWTADLNVGLWAYYKFDETGGAVTDSVGHYDGINSGATTGETGKLGNSYLFESSENDYVNITNILTDYGTISVNAWIKPLETTESDWAGIFGNNAAGKNDDLNFMLQKSTGKLYLERQDDTTATNYAIAGDSNITDNTWHMVTAILNSSGMFLFVDGSVQADTSAFYEASTNQGYFGIGGFLIIRDDDFRGWIDELGVWNRSLSQDEITQLYNEGNGITYSSTPVIIIYSPEDYYNSTTNDIEFITGISGTPPANVSIYINGILNETNSSGIIGNYTFDKTLDDGFWNWTIESCNAEGCAESSRYLTIDTSPQIVIYSPEDGGIYTDSTIWFNATASQEVDTWIVNYNGTNHTLSSINSTLEVEDGDFDLEFWGRDSESLIWGMNYSVSFLVDTTSPYIEETSLNGTTQDYLYQNKNMTLTYNVSDIHLDSCTWEYNSTNSTISCVNNTANNYYFDYEVGKDYGYIYANDTYGLLTKANVSWEYKVLENSRTFSTNIFETETETYSINVSANASLSGVKLNWNSSNYTLTNSGGLWSYTRDTPIGNGTYNFTYLFDYAGKTINSYNSTQNVNFTYFTETDGTYTDVFLNITFKDENDLSIINASIPTSTFVYYLGTGSVNKTLIYSNSSNNLYYAFSGTTGTKTLYVEPTLQYRRISDYPQRIWTPTTQEYNSTDTNQVLYLLGSIDGIYVTYQVENTAGTLISGVDVTATRQQDGVIIQVGHDITDAAGTVTFWENPDFQHTVLFSKEGYDDFTFVHFPTQNAYTITIGGTTITNYSCSREILQTIRPNSDFLWKNNEYDFNYTISTNYWNLTEFGFTLTSDTGVNLGSDTDTSSNGGTIYVNNLNVSDYSGIIMTYYYEVDSEYCSQISGQRLWIIQSEEGTDYSIYNLATRFNTYTSVGLFGIDDFGKTFISFLIIILIVGGVSRRYGLASEASAMAILFSVVYILDVGLNFIPRIHVGTFTSVNHFPTIITFIILFMMLIREETGR